uniref:Uncharacterized protein n=1 Tax=Ascaris lumbricoides TaxID=6252 RepID=A0A0M3HLF8_ASCLU
MGSDPSYIWLKSNCMVTQARCAYKTSGDIGSFKTDAKKPQCTHSYCTIL